MAAVEKFKLILLVQNYIKEMIKVTENFPKTGKILREELIKDSFEILNKISIGNNSHNKKLKKTFADEAIGDVKVAEFLVEICEENNYINSKSSYFYLNDMDHYIKEKLKIKCYVRYQDDFLLYSDSKEYLEYCKEQIINFLRKEDLVLNNKTGIYSNNKNFIFIGRNQKGQYSKRRTVRRRLKKERYLYFKDKIKINSYISSIVSLKKLSGIKNL